MRRSTRWVVVTGALLVLAFAGLGSAQQGEARSALADGTPHSPSDVRIFLVFLSVATVSWLMYRVIRRNWVCPPSPPAPAPDWREERRNRQREMAEKAEEQSANSALELAERHTDLVNRFLSIAERKVSTLDEYGDENWKDLDKEVFRCIEKIAEKENGTVSAFGSPRKYKSGSLAIPALQESDLYRLYKHLFGNLEERFRAYHAERANKQCPLDEISRMTGVEFENYLLRLLKQHGCAVNGTPQAGDKGADIIACIGNRVIVIQAKRSAAPVGNRAVQEVVAALAYYKGTEAWVMTNSVFTEAARELAERNSVRLVGGSDLRNVSELLKN
jgi:hypothetical protein